MCTHYCTVISHALISQTSSYQQKCCLPLIITGISIENLRDNTTQDDLERRQAVFTFDINPRISPSLSLAYSVQLQWSELRKEFGSNHGSRTFYLPFAGNRSCGGTPNSTLEVVGDGSYKLTVDVAVLGSGPLSINISISLVCLRVTSHFCPLCSEWLYTSDTSSNIDISAKRGESTHSIQATCILSLCIHEL